MARSAADLQRRRRLAPVALALVAINGVLGTYGIWRTYQATRARRLAVEQVTAGAITPDVYGIVHLPRSLRSAAFDGLAAVTQTDAATWIVLPRDRDGVSVTAYLWCSAPGALHPDSSPLLKIPDHPNGPWVKIHIVHIDGPNWARGEYTSP